MGHNYYKRHETHIFSTASDTLVMILCLFVVQAVFQSDIGALLEQVGTGKESLSFMKRRIRRLAAQWASAARRLDDKLRSHWREQKRVSTRRRSHAAG